MTEATDKEDTRKPFINSVRILKLPLATGESETHLQEQWNTSSLYSAVSRFASVQLLFEGNDLTAASNPLAVVIFYDSRNEQSIESAWSSLQSYQDSPRVFLADATAPVSGGNSIEPPEKYQWPESAVFISADMSQLTLLFNTIIVKPLLDSLTDQDIQEIACTASERGHIDVLKLLLSAEKAPPPLLWLERVLNTLQSMSCTDRGVPQLLEVAELAYNLNIGETMEYLQTRWSITPRSTLLVLCRLTNPFNSKPEQLLLARQNLSTLPPASIADTAFTHITLSGNSLKAIPEELLQLRCLQVLDVSYNMLEKLPPFLRWNCPKLREFDASFNLLVDGSRGIIRQQTERRKSYASGDPHSAPQQKVLLLTSHNIYSCVFSLSDVNLSHNPRLTCVPEWVSVLPHLVRLNLKQLPKLRELPKSLANFTDLTIILVDPDNMLSPPASICQQGSQAIITYLRSQLRGCSTYRHMNVMLLGWGRDEERKTLSRKLVSQRPTHASDMESGTYDYRGELLDRSIIKVTYHVLDFSSEAMNLSLYQCFLVHRSVYLCLWNVRDGKDGLRELVPVLRNIQSCMPRSRVLLLAMYSGDDGAPLTVTHADVLQWVSAVLGVENPSALHDERYSSSHGLPCIGQTMIVNINSKEDAEKIRELVHLQAGQLQVKGSSERLIEEQVPRSYTTLQSHVESKIKLRSSIVSYGELIDSFRAISHQSGDLTDDEREFALACQFLHDSGTLFHYHSPNETASDLFFLNLQWLSNTLTKILNSSLSTVTGTMTSSELTENLSSLGLSSGYHHPIISIMVEYNLLVPLNVERNCYLFLCYLSSILKYPRYILSNDNLYLRRVSFRYFPQSLFSQLLSRVLTYSEQLGAQLMTLKDPSLTSLLSDRKNDYQAEPSPISGQVSAIKRGKYFKLSRGGYIIREKELENVEDTSVALKKVRALSVTSPLHEAHRDSLHSKMQALSRNFVDELPKFSESDNSWVTTHTFSRCLLWENGVFIEFLDGTLAWIESAPSTITCVAQGLTNEAGVKTLAFLLSSCQFVCEERYSSLERSLLSPCRQCLKNSKLTFFALKEIQPATEQSMICTECHQEQSLFDIAPDHMLMDFPDNLRLNADKLVFEEKEETCLGKQVYQGTYNNENVVLKLFENDSVNSLSALRSEFNILSSISHTHIIQALGVLVHPLSIVLPLAPQGSLHDHLELCPNGLNDRLSHISLHQIAQGIKYLHSLNIIHRDIKPGNILVWSLHPTNGVHVKITDCGLSQYIDPFGFRRLRGTEDYMAPELYATARKRLYTEKVDIFSFGILLYNIVTGKRFIPSLYRKRGERERQLSIPHMSIIASAIEEQKLQGGRRQSPALKLLENGVHPAARQGHITMCISTCMQVLLEDCLSVDPKRRPTADGISARLLVCVGPSTQEKYVLDQECRISGAALLTGGEIIAWELGGEKRLFQIASDTFSTQLKPHPIGGEVCRFITVAADKLFLVTSTKKIHSYSLPDFETCVSAKNPLAATPTCLFAARDASMIVVGLEGGRIAVFSSRNEENASALSWPPMVAKPFDHPDKKKTQVSCGVVTGGDNGNILCNSGRYLVGLGVTQAKVQQLYFKPLSEKGTLLKGMVEHGCYLWCWFADDGEIVICDISTGNRLDSIELLSILRDSIGDLKASSVLVSMVTAGSDAMWVGTSDGHLFGFHHESFELLTAVHQHSSVDAVICTSGMLLVFGCWLCGGEGAESDVKVGGFTMWRLHMDSMVV